MTPIPAQIKSADLNDHVQAWYAEFVNIEQSDLFEMTIAENFMNRSLFQQNQRRLI